MEHVRTRVAKGEKINPRRASGFYWRYGKDSPHDSPARLRHFVEKPDFRIVWGIARNVFESDQAVTMRQIRADVHVPREGQPVAHLSFDLFRAKRGRYVDDVEFVDCCDTYNQDVYDLAYGLAKAGLDLLNISSAARCCTSEAWK